MSYKTTFTITPASGPYLMPFDIIGKIADGEECCVINHNGATLCAIHRGGEFTRPGNASRVMNVKEATPIPAEDQWPKGCDWSTDDWEDRGIYPPRPVQQAVLIVTMPDGTSFEVVAPFTDETPQSDEAQINYQVNLDTFERHIRNAYQYSHYPYVLPSIKTRWAWMPE
jgi:hypothetical protein